MTRSIRLLKFPLMVPLVAVAATLAGCSAAPVVPVAQATDKATQGEATHDEAHALPPHHPRTFLRAIDEIERRCETAVRDAAAGDRPDPRARREFDDILRWLPALAADTELGRAAWERVRSIAATLAADLDAPAPPAGLADRCRAAVAGLRAAAATLPRLPDDTTAPEGSP